MKSRDVRSFKRSGEAGEPCLNSREVAARFGFKTPQSLAASVHSGCFPAPDFTSGITCARSQWKLSTLAKEERRRAQKLERK